MLSYVPEVAILLINRRSGAVHAATWLAEDHIYRDWQKESGAVPTVCKDWTSVGSD